MRETDILMLLSLIIYEHGVLSYLVTIFLISISYEANLHINPVYVLIYFIFYLEDVIINTIILWYFKFQLFALAKSTCILMFYPSTLLYSLISSRFIIFRFFSRQTVMLSAVRSSFAYSFLIFISFISSYCFIALDIK